MATIPQHISDTRHMIKSFQDDSYYTDEYILKKMDDARAFLLDQQVNKTGAMNDFYEQSFCMPMDVSTYHDCDCLPVDTSCKVLKSRWPIPHVLSSTKRKNRYALKVKTIDGNNISYIEDSSLVKKYKYSKTKSNKPLWTISNSHLYIFNTLTLKVVLLEGIFENPAELVNLTLCTDDGDDTDQNCFSLDTMEYPMEPGLHQAMYKEMLQMMAIPMQIPDDITNNAISENG